ncbi:hypothetical protein FQA39_LY07181 [Lamprigera yunnana]|nr:hypothetical protein FQA39_LY07181 [Lamprigera yunnana]
MMEILYIVFKLKQRYNHVPDPSGKPTIITAHNTSATALFISWRPPLRQTIHGEFLGYRISYRPRDHPEEATKQIYIRNPSAESHPVLYEKDLDASYKIKLDAQDAAGYALNDDEMNRLNEISKAIREPKYWD